MAFGLLADVQSGYPTLLSELTLTTAVRTALPPRHWLRSRWLARVRPRWRSSASGAQSEFQALAFMKCWASAKSASLILIATLRSG
jgi:ornithine cyclodeaminase